MDSKDNKDIDKDINVESITYYSMSTRGFYRNDIHKKEKIPVDAVIISDDLRQSLLAGEAEGKIIVADEEGKPHLTDRIPSEEEKKSILQMEARTALNTSDRVVLRYFEKNLPVPLSWAAYRADLRAIVSGTSSETSLPEKPPYD